MYTLFQDACGNDIALQRNSDAAFLPFDPDNADFRAFESWRVEGNEANSRTLALTGSNDDANDLHLSPAL